MYAFFDYPYTMRHVVTTRGSMVQTGVSKGDYTNETKSEVDITGNFDTINMDADERPFSYEGPIQNNGEARLFTSAAIQKGDYIRVALDEAATQWETYRVMELRSNHGMMGALTASEGRREWLLKKVEETVT